MNYSYFKFFCVIFFFSSLILGVSSKSGFFIWVSFELGAMTFIPLVESFSCFMSVALMKYYMIQSVASFFFLFFVILKYVAFYDLYFSLEFFVFLMMWVKLGFFPFSSWYYQVSENMTWALWFMLNTFQKLLPLWVITMFMCDSYFIYIALLLNSIYMVSEIFNQVSLRWMVNSSSLNHFSWMIVSAVSFVSSWELYFLIYFLINFMLFSVMIKNNWAGVMSMMFPKSLSLVLLYFMVFFNFMGVPPFVGFLGKILILYLMSSFYFLIFLLGVTVTSSVIYMCYFMGSLSKIMYCKLNNNFVLMGLLVSLSSILPLGALLWVL